MNFSPKTTLVQTQTLSQTQLQSLKILSLDNFELNNFLQNEYIENPLLDYNENQIFLHGINMFPIPLQKKTRIFTKKFLTFRRVESKNSFWIS